MRHLVILLLAACTSTSERVVEPLVTDETTTLAFKYIPWDGELQAEVLYDHVASTVSGEVVISRDGVHCGWQLPTPAPLVEPSRTSLSDELALATVVTNPACEGCGDLIVNVDYFTVTLADGRGFSTDPCACNEFEAGGVTRALVDAVAGAGGAAAELRFVEGRFEPTERACPFAVP